MNNIEALTEYSYKNKNLRNWGIASELTCYQLEKKIAESIAELERRIRATPMPDNYIIVGKGLERESR